ncbi:hypothetical protein [Salininema proteolyticum]|uniref:Uncharacterized protein n=1 Tax=Salininema proteolyticum TaxID=1607685 RepID=A0ABV8TTL0_9ACTN
MSAIPVGEKAGGDNIRPDHDLSHAMPNPEIFNNIVRSLRPAGCEVHALDILADSWYADVFQKISTFPGDLRVATSQLSEEWVGDDYDNLEKKIEDTIKIAQEVSDSAEVITDDLMRESADIYSQQGGEEGYVPFPAPQLWKEGGIANWFRSWGDNDDMAVHCRPPWWDEGPCNRITAEYALQMVGFKPEEMGEFTQSIREETQRRQQANQEFNQQLEEGSYYRGRSMDKKETDWDELYDEVREEAIFENEDMMQIAEDDYEQAAQDINSGIKDREYNANTSYSTHEDPTEAKDPTMTSEEDPNAGGGGYDGVSPPPGGGGAGAGAGGLGDPGGYDSPKEYGLKKPGGPGGPGGSNPDVPGIGDPDDPEGWDFGEDGRPRVDDPTGGLAGGGDGLGGMRPGIGGGGSGLGGGAGGGLGGGGLGGGAGVMGGGAGMPRGGAGAGGAGAKVGPGAGGGAGAGRGGGGRAGGGMMAGGGGGGMGRPGGDDKESKGEAAGWLVEDEDVWGIGDEDDDPYA